MGDTKKGTTRTTTRAWHRSSGAFYMTDPPAKTRKGRVFTTTRIGLSKAAHHPYRFYLKSNPCVSRK